ncbi:uncharacterized protein BDCG_00031 [Blastomyces dermatitidis ER-3]|uniref:Uncharacterized protein n=1 Tax=Ajellomyces dermatitidis (strain ER-3 / ATCC MYA-2586) TaxID=559297 RepID=A0ABP2ENV9_AJEDR|nr:uncharacterized protein BDCG_00031 [Blastomyces dermatitidis ER-3]EEQ83226.2 hypothetical protein BDCG_00031 [Blastomyces dermatitidis ER-3]EQL31503.1 hypothetical protein BDFG_06188 [Blastomyces dermatitidis ATCC 26199]
MDINNNDLIGKTSLRPHPGRSVERTKANRIGLQPPNDIIRRGATRAVRGLAAVAKKKTRDEV